MPSDRSAPPAPTLQMGGREWAMLCGLALLWGCSFPFFKIMAGALPPFTIVLCRVGGAALVLNLVMLVLRRPLPRDPALWGGVLLMGLLTNVMGFSLTAYGIRYISSGMASILNASTPVFTVLLAHLMTRDDRLTPQRALGVAAGFAGVAVLIGPSALGHADGKALIGQACSVIGSALAALAAIYGRRIRGVHPLEAATCQMTGSALIILPLSLIFEHPWTLPPPTPAVWGAIAGIAVLSTVLAFLLYFRILATAGATNLQLVTFLIPVVSIALGAVLLGERLPARAYVGMGVIALGLLLIDGRLLRRIGSRRL